MAQQAFLRALDAAAIQAFKATGMADAASYVAPDGTAVDCSVLVDYAAQFFGDDGAPIAGNRITVTLQLSEVADPVRYATVTVGDDVYTLSERVLQDQSLSIWVVTRG